MDRLLLDGQNGKRSTIEIDSLVVRQVDLVTAETAPVGDVTAVDADNMKRTVFQRRTWVWTDGLVVAVNIVEERCRVLFLGNVCCRPNYHIPTTAKCVINSNR